MHIILGVLGAVITILILINRLSEAGMDIGWLNPFSWHRRRKYRIQHDLNPLFKLESPLDVAALLLLGVAKVDGDITLNQKNALLGLFQQEFRLSASEAKALLASSAHLIGNGQEFFTAPDKVIKPSFDKFTADQVASLNKLLQQIATLDGPASTEQEAYIRQVQLALPLFSTEARW
ncbi:TerB family tellurite resistance protein [Arsukibacterium sp.]|uniref:TerB family tellurite resistance protein n=1 Tax=Arsukibacterium sp. TaxID=1977258 RepID=UPI002FD973FC